ncbi:Gibberellin 20 oxidase 1 [Platanthera guangdongensis]|uniref:Gibberellin 20 oxidase 1 n=1 Tax=Platanthera guangdongensis TaxID=2320717 RepID=A0ABR2LIW7_9ASPA
MTTASSTPKSRRRVLSMPRSPTQNISGRREHSTPRLWSASSCEIKKIEPKCSMLPKTINIQMVAVEIRSHQWFKNLSSISFHSSRPAYCGIAMATSVLPSYHVQNFSSVKALVINSSHNSTTEATFNMPSVYVARNPALAAAEIISDEEIPTIDLSLLRSEQTSADERAKLIRRLGEACEDWGCFMVVNHGVPEDLQRRMVEAYSDFFDMKDEEKQQFNAKQIFDPIAYNTSFSGTGTEVLYWRDTLTTKIKLFRPSSPALRQMGPSSAILPNSFCVFVSDLLQVYTHLYRYNIKVFLS